MKHFGTPPGKSTTVFRVTKSTFKVGVHELDDGPKELSGPLPRDFLGQILKDTDVEPAGPDTASLDLVLTKNGPEVLVQGSLDVTVSLPCARTLDPAIYRLRPEVFLMLTPAGNHDRRRSPERERRDKGRKGAKKSAWDADPELSEEEAALDTYSGDHIELDGFLREFILLEVPMVPLREDLRDQPFEANPPLPDAAQPAESSGEKPLDPRLSPLQALKARLENKE